MPRQIHYFSYLFLGRAGNACIMLTLMDHDGSICFAFFYGFHIDICPNRATWSLPQESIHGKKPEGRWSEMMSQQLFNFEGALDSYLLNFIDIYSTVYIYPKVTLIPYIYIYLSQKYG